jgi:aminopeptidase N
MRLEFYAFSPIVIFPESNTKQHPVYSLYSRNPILAIGFKAVICLPILLILLVGCRSRKAAQTEKAIAGKSTEIESLLDSLDRMSEFDQGAVNLLPQPQDSYQPSAARIFRLIHTRLELTPNWDSAQLIGKAQLTLSPWFTPSDSLVLDAKGFIVHSVRLISPTYSPLAYSYQDSAHLHIALGKSYTRKEKLIIEIEYTANPSSIQSGGSAAIHSDRGLYFINADGKDSIHPQQLWTQGEPESSSCWFPTLDAPNQKTTQEIYLTVPDSFISLSNGKLISSVKNSQGMRTDYWKQDKPHAPYLFMIAAGKFSKISETWRGMPVEYFVEPAYAKYAKMTFGNTPEMLEFFSNKFNYPYPWDKYAQIVVREFVSGAMENTGAVVHFEYLQQDSCDFNDGNYEDIIAHELAHHWFGDLVTAESWSQICLNESFASYGEYLWKEHKYGKEEAARHLRNDLTVYLYRSGSKHKPLVRHYFHEPGDVFDVHSYQKGACILHYLRSIAGDEAFFETLSRYLKQREFNSAEVHHLRLILEEVTGKDWHSFFSQWFYTPGHPTIEMEEEWDEISGETLISIQQAIEGGKSEVWSLPLELLIFEGTQPKYIPFTLNTRDTLIRYKSDKSPKAVVLDPKRVLPGRIREKRSTEDWRFLFDYAQEASLKSQALDELSLSLSEDSVFQFFCAVASNDSLHEGLPIQAMEVLTYYEGTASLKLTLKALNWCRNPNIRIRMAAYELLRQQYDLLNDEGQIDEALKTSVKQVMELGLSDSSYVIQALSLEGYYLLDEKAALAHARNLKASRNGHDEILLAALKILNVSEDSAYFPLIHESLKAGLPGSSRFVILNLLEGELASEQSEIRQNEIKSILTAILYYDPMPEMRQQAAIILRDWSILYPEQKASVIALLEGQLIREKNPIVCERIEFLLKTE